MKFILIITVVFFISCKREKSFENDYSNKDISWAKGAVWYQIFPERFRNADSTNDPKIEEVPYAYLQPGWQPHPWGSDYYKMQPWELKKSNKFYDTVFERRYGGDLMGVINKLDYLKELGVDAVYFNPVFEAPSLHKYDGATFHHIDNNFGPDSDGDLKKINQANETEEPSSWVWTKADSVFLQLIKEAHKRDLKVIIDGVFNHTGTTFFAFEDVLRNQKQSRYADWYDIKKWDDPDTPENEFEYQGWAGFKGLPEFAEDDNGLMPGVKKYVYDITKRWMDPNDDGDPSDGIDGWRLDVADQVAPVFWKEWYKHVKSINPNALIIAEIWTDASEAIHDKRFDGVKNYPFAYSMVEFFINEEKSIDAVILGERLTEIVKNYGEDAAHILWNLMDSHDTDRLASMILNPDYNYDRMRSPRDNPDYILRKPTREERKTQKLIAVFQMTHIGSPLIYYGTEAGMWGADDPDDRKPMLWDDIEFENESSHPIQGETRPSDKNIFDYELFTFYKKLINLRKNNQALRHGSFKVIAELTKGDIFAFRRSTDKQSILIIFNRSDSEHQLEIKYNGKVRDIFNNQNFESKQNLLRLSIEKQSFMILEEM